MRLILPTSFIRKIFKMAQKVTVPTVKLSNGLDFPVVGLGTYKVI